MRLWFSILRAPWKKPQSTRTLADAVSTRYADPVTSPPPAPSTVTFTKPLRSAAPIADCRDGARRAATAGRVAPHGRGGPSDFGPIGRRRARGPSSRFDSDQQDELVL